MSLQIDFDNSYVQLPERFYRAQSPQPVRSPQLVRVNAPLCDYLGIDASALASTEGVEVLAGNRVPDGAQPVATAYAGHQFGNFNPQLGDGRAVLLGEVVARDGERHDLQLKGSGMTPFSRGGDGRSPLGPVLREYIVSEAMAVLGVPTTRALAAVTTGEPVMREQVQPGGVLLRVARSHIRIGTFEYFAARDDRDGLRALLDHVVARHYPEAAEHPQPALAVLAAVAERQAALVARWQLLGFIHGVMNTDNMLISGETIDYGPCAFMEAYADKTVFSSIDRMGRYAYGNQAPIAQWNIACLARALLPLFADAGDDAVAEAQRAIDAVPGVHAAALQRGYLDKLGLSPMAAHGADDAELVKALLAAMRKDDADFTLTFRHLIALADPQLGAPGERLRAAYTPGPALTEWLPRWRARFDADDGDVAQRVAAMRRASPARIARNHLVEACIRAAEDDGDLGPFHALVEALAEPDAEDDVELMRPARDDERVEKTFCGT